MHFGQAELVEIVEVHVIAMKTARVRRVWRANFYYSPAASQRIPFACIPCPHGLQSLPLFAAPFSARNTLSGKILSSLDLISHLLLAGGLSFSLSSSVILASSVNAETPLCWFKLGIKVDRIERDKFFDWHYILQTSQFFLFFLIKWNVSQNNV